jgi:LysM repeat protein
MSDAKESKEDRVVSRISRIVVVKPGDTLQTLAREHYEDESLAADLARVNGTAINAILIAGSKVKLPHRSRLRAPIAKRELGATPETEIETVTVTAQETWWRPYTPIIAGLLGFGLAWILTNRKKLLKF